ncbi:MAG TPA: hypothetical protein VF720_13295 [Candidatus Eisenbacteria bacterium]
MGRDVTCPVTVNGETRTARVLLETGEIIIQGRPRLKVAFRDMKELAAGGGILSFRGEVGQVRIDLGAKAAEWLASIRTPTPRLDKLGVKLGMTVIATGLDDDLFLAEVTARIGAPVRGRLSGRADIVFLGARSATDLGRLAAARRAIAPDGTIWVVWPKGRKEFGENHVRASALDTGLVDVKVVAFDDTMSALKLVIPLKLRGRA